MKASLSLPSRVGEGARVQDRRRIKQRCRQGNAVETVLCEYVLGKYMTTTTTTTTPRPAGPGMPR